MKKTPIFLIVLFFLLILIPQVCAQTKTVSAEEAATMRKTFVEYSKRYIGKPYQRGAMGPDAFDCSGLVFACSRESLGIQLPRQTTAMYAFCEIIDETERAIGDLVFFKTTDSGFVSHVGIYAGNDQFINCASDGPNTGVIISSLKEKYWGAHYFQTGRFLPKTTPESLSTQTETAESAATASATTGTSNANTVATAQNTTTASPAKADAKEESYDDSRTFWEKIIIDASLSLDWNFYTAASFKLNARGASSMIHAMYDGKTVRPGVGTMIRYDGGTGTVQLPIIASITLGNYFRAFFGPVIGIGRATLPGDNDTRIKHSFFPGIMGVCWQTPSFGIGKTRVSFQQDVHYTFFDDTDKSALSFKNGLVSGLVFSSGVRVTLPLANML